MPAAETVGAEATVDEGLALSGGMDGMEGAEGATAAEVAESVGGGVPIVGALIGGGMAVAKDLRAVNSGEMKAGDATADVAVNTAIGAGAALAGAEAGMAAGAAIGTMIPIPVVGTAAGLV